MTWSTMLFRSMFVLTVCLAVVAVVPFTADAKQAGPTKEKSAAVAKEAALAASGQQEKPAAESAGEIRVTGVKNHDPKLEPNQAGLRHKVLVAVENIAAFRKQTEGKPVVLFLDGMGIEKVYPEAWDMAGGTIRFRLNRTKGCEPAWDNLLGSPGALTKQVSVSIGVEKGQPVPTLVDGEQKFDLIVLRPFGLAFWAVVMIAIVFGVFFWLGPRTSVLRNFGKASPYSLALVQMAWWSILIFMAFIFLWLITGTIPVVSGSSLTLLGIGAGTALGARIIDEGKLTKRLNALLPQKEQIEQELKKTDLSQEKKTDLEQSVKDVNAQIKEVRSAGAKTTSQGFWNDILNDVNGMSLHRFQIVVWSFILGVMFVVEVYRNLAMPQLNAELLALMGISSGAYLGFKFPESVRLTDRAPDEKDEASGDKKPA